MICPFQTLSSNMFPSDISPSDMFLQILSSNFSFSYSPQTVPLSSDMSSSDILQSYTPQIPPSYVSSSFTLSVSSFYNNTAQTFHQYLHHIVMDMPAIYPGYLPSHKFPTLPQQALLPPHSHSMKSCMLGLSNLTHARWVMDVLVSGTPPSMVGCWEKFQKSVPKWITWHMMVHIGKRVRGCRGLQSLFSNSHPEAGSYGKAVSASPASENLDPQIYHELMRPLQ